MKEMRRLLALVLCIVMLVGIVPAGVFATETDVPAEEPAITDLGEKGSAEPTESAPMPGATPVLVEESEDAPVLAADGETPIDAAVIFSDLHTRSNDGISDYTGDVSKHRYTEAGALLTGIMGGIKQLGLPVSTVSSAGDAFAVDNDGDYSGGKGKFIGYTSVLNGYIRSALEDNDLPIYYVWTDHDRYAKAEDNTIDLPKDSRFVYGAGEDDIYGNADDDNYYIFLLSILDTSTNERYGIQPRSATEVEASIESFLDVAEDLDTTKPLFIVAHQPLLDKRNDNGYAYKWWTAIDSIAKGMDVAYFYGHNHNYDDSSYYYYGVGDTMAVCTNSSGASTNVTMSFAHINAGYMNPTTGTDKPSTRTGVAVGALIYEDRIEYKTYRATGVDTQTLKLAKSQDRAFIIKTVECEIGNGDTVTATSQALTAVTAEWNYVDLSETLDVETAAAYDVAVEGYIQGDIQVEMEVGYVSAQNLKLYFVGEGGALTEIAPTSVVATETGVKVAFTATSPAFTVAVGNPPVAVPEDAVLESLTVVAPEKTNYFDSDEEEVEGVGTVISLNITGMVVTANYVNGAETYSETLEWDRWGQVEGGYSLSFEGLAPGDYGEKTVTVSYGGKTATFTVWVCPTSVVVEGEENITASFDAPGVMAMTATKVTDEETYEAVALLLELLVDGELTILDFQPTYANGDTALDGKARVTMPIPEGLTKPVVYFVSDDGSTYEKMPTTVNTADNTLTFETTHFSKYVVGDEGSVPSIEVEPETVPVNKSEQINKPVYLLVTGNPTGNVLIANSNSGSGYLLKNNNGQVDDINVVIQSRNLY